MTDPNRARFEEWASGEGGNIARHVDGAHRYASSTVQGWWKAWVAAAALTPAPAQPESPTAGENNVRQ